MKNFNLKYEYLDAHDDYCAQLSKGDTGFIPFWDSNNCIDIANELDQQCELSECVEAPGEVKIEVFSAIGWLER